MKLIFILINCFVFLTSCKDSKENIELQYKGKESDDRINLVLRNATNSKDYIIWNDFPNNREVTFFEGDQRKYAVQLTQKQLEYIHFFWNQMDIDDYIANKNLRDTLSPVLDRDLLDITIRKNGKNVTHRVFVPISVINPRDLLIAFPRSENYSPFDDVEEDPIKVYIDTEYGIMIISLFLKSI